MKAVRAFVVLLAVMILGVSGSSNVARSEVGGLHLNITPFGGYTDWDKKVNLENRAHFGARGGIGLGRYLSIEGYYTWMKSETRFGAGDSLFLFPGITTQPTTDMDVQSYGADGILNLIPKSVINPYVLAGWHEEKITDDPGTVRNFMNGLEYGGGIKIGAKRVALRLEVRDKLWSFDPPAPDETAHNLWYSGGIQVSLGGSTGRDEDHDGVKDSEDKCPGTPRGAQVDASGCPLDSDRDNVPDGIDECPNTPAGAIVDARGCPTDSDGDGVPDGIDQCPGTAAGTQVDARGCPQDSDNDSVPDNLDRCANTPAGAKVDASGCPIDSDNDGVPDGIDQCPGTPAGTRVDAKGCSTDSDNDGVPDDKDLCPNTPASAKVDADGCPLQLSEREVELLDKGRITTREIHFTTAKWDILPESNETLDDIGKILIQWPRLRIEIGGHTDSRGSLAYNHDLSHKRAQSVLDYLLQHFPQINREQYTAVGYGETKPIASNKTVEGMAKNRRVEFKVLNTEELKKERERRRLLQKGE